jgi:uncharacterized protein (TIGR03083 family)
MLEAVADMGKLIRTERQALVELLETLTQDQWATPSLCTGWTVQDVAAHVAWMPALPARQSVRERSAARPRLSFDADRQAHWRV